jgi:hypothetical protein
MPNRYGVPENPASRGNWQNRLKKNRCGFMRTENGSAKRTKDASGAKRENGVLRTLTRRIHEEEEVKSRRILRRDFAIPQAKLQAAA